MDSLLAPARDKQAPNHGHVEERGRRHVVERRRPPHVRVRRICAPVRKRAASSGADSFVGIAGTGDRTLRARSSAVIRRQIAPRVNDARLRLMRDERERRRAGRRVEKDGRQERKIDKSLCAKREYAAAAAAPREEDAPGRALDR